MNSASISTCSFSGSTHRSGRSRSLESSLHVSCLFTCGFHFLILWSSHALVPPFYSEPNSILSSIHDFFHFLSWMFRAVVAIFVFISLNFSPSLSCWCGLLVLARLEGGNLGRDRQHNIFPFSAGWAATGVLCTKAWGRERPPSLVFSRPQKCSGVGGSSAYCAISLKGSPYPSDQYTPLPPRVRCSTITACTSSLQDEGFFGLICSLSHQFSLEPSSLVLVVSKGS